MVAVSISLSRTQGEFVRGQRYMPHLLRSKTKLCPAQVRRRLLNGLSLHRLPRNVTSCIMSQPSSASNAHFAAASPLCVKKLFSKSMFFIALAA